MNNKTSRLFFLTSISFCLLTLTATAQTPPTTPSTSQPQPSTQKVASLSYQIETYNSQVMGGSRTYGVSLPPGYAQNPQQSYPVVFLLHGGHGSPIDWFKLGKGKALTTLEQLYATGKLPPSIIITPDGNDKRGSSPYRDPEYFDGPNGNVSTAIGKELVQVVKSRYRTLPNPDFWAIGGLSSGGWGAVNVGLRNLNNFSILFSHSGYFQDKSGPANSPITYIKDVPSAAKKRLRIYLDTGSSDRDEVKESKDFSQELARLNIYHVFREYSGGHTWQYWREHLADSLTFVGEQFKTAQTASTSKNLLHQQ
ncbi:alpha/beta hydrolase [Anabaena azotica]|uniref:Esterase family protein n=1 Tax=Anabaena azotica FACHB-119 TaxID=947527 RepID=A0ABR8D8I2_9NOST|nr:alpha/beta hydrolase-fold protein [Anabaena azotica]MBD2502058.1 esterase family protein [Anabaena azotica FACHB-119]